eukprot:6860412-Prymnesium_polylepis.1
MCDACARCAVHACEFPRDWDSHDATRWSHTRCDQSRDRTCGGKEEERTFVARVRRRESRSVQVHALSK